MPTTRKKTLETISGNANFFSCSYSPGATKAQAW